MTAYEKELSRIDGLSDNTQKRAALVALRDYLHRSSGFNGCPSPQVQRVQKLINELGKS